MTNPSSIVRLHSRKGGRGSVHEANMAFQPYETGLLTGTGVVPSSGLIVTVGGSAGNPDVAIATTPDGYKIALDIVGTTNLTITAPSTNKRYTAIVAYTDDLSITSTDTATYGNPSSCGLITVNGNTSSSPNYPTDSQIRTAITADGATGSQAAYAVVGYILMSSNTSTITSGIITIPAAGASGTFLKDSSVEAKKLDFSSFGFGNYSTSETKTGFTWTDGKPIYQKTLSFPALGTQGQAVVQPLAGTDTIVELRGIMRKAGDSWAIPYVYATVSFESGNVSVRSVGSDLSTFSATVTVFYTKA